MGERPLYEVTVQIDGKVKKFLVAYTVEEFGQLKEEAHERPDEEIKWKIGAFLSNKAHTITSIRLIEDATFIM
jgi:hypothetical protein